MEFVAHQEKINDNLRLTVYGDAQYHDSPFEDGTAVGSHILPVAKAHTFDANELADFLPNPIDRESLLLTGINPAERFAFPIYGYIHGPDFWVNHADDLESPANDWGNLVVRERAIGIHYVHESEHGGNRERAYQIAQENIGLLQMWAQGDVYMVVVERPCSGNCGQWEHLDAWGGIYGLEQAIADGKELAQEYC